ncbi:MAG: DotA/TraY family protein [Methyloprofundus sp.]|nr:DotA/TraY family protein [Methyloprofundus sp.]
MAEPSEEQVNTLAQHLPSLDVNERDFSMMLLENLYGSSWTENIGQASSIQHQSLFSMFSTFNSLVLSAVAFIVLYAAVMGVLGAGTTGTPFGKKMSLFWTPLRLATSIGLLAPMPFAGGLAVIQVIILSAVLASINIANKMNSTFYEFMSSSLVYESGSTDTNSGLPIGAISAIKEVQGDNFKDNIILASVYSGALRGYVDAMSEAGEATALENAGIEAIPYDRFIMLEVEEPGWVAQGLDYIGFGDEKDNIQKVTINFYPFKASQKLPWYSWKIGWFDGVGVQQDSVQDVLSSTFSYSCPIGVGNTSAYFFQEDENFVASVAEPDNMCQEIEAMLLNGGAANGLGSLALLGEEFGRLFYQNQKASGEEGSSLPENPLDADQISSSSQMIDVVLDIVTEGMSDYFMLTKAAEVNRDFAGIAKEAGWLMAGTFYMTRAKLMRDIEQNFKLNSEAVIHDNDDLYVLMGERSETLYDGLKNISETVMKSTINPDTMSFRGLTERASGSLLEINSGGNELSKGIGSLVGWIVTKANPVTLMSDTDPIRALQNTGRTYLTVGITGVVMGYGIYKGFSGWGKGKSEDGKAEESGERRGFFKSLTASIGYMIMGYFLLIIFLVGALLLGMMISALIYVFYIPLIPTLMWLSGVINWAIFTMEAMIAGPIWAAAHAAPEGEGIAGQHAKQGYVLLLQILLRPSLLLLGLFLGYAFLKILGILIGALLIPSIMVNSMAGASETEYSGIGMRFLGGLSDLALAPLYVLAGIIIITVVAVTYIHRVFDMTFSFADNVMRWAGHGSGGLGEKDDMGRFQQAAAGAAGAALGSQVSRFTSGSMASTMKSLASKLAGSGTSQQMGDSGSSGGDKKGKGDGGNGSGPDRDPTPTPVGGGPGSSGSGEGEGDSGSDSPEAAGGGDKKPEPKLAPDAKPGLASPVRDSPAKQRFNKDKRS